MLIRPAIRALLLYLVAQTAVVALIFLFVSSFFTAWDGAVVSVRQPRTPDPAVYKVLIMNTDGTSLERTWSAAIVTPLALPVDSLALAPSTFPEDAAKTRKARFQMNFLLQIPGAEGADPTWTSFPTMSPQALGIALLAWLVGLGLRNMLYAGSPIALERSKVFLPKAQSASGSVAGGSGGRTRGRKQPPPGRKRRGPRR